MIETEVIPRGPYSFAMTARRAYDATRSFLDGVLTCALEDQVVHAWQLPSGALAIRAETDEGVDRLRWILALDDDHSEFLARFADDELLREPIRQLRGFRPLRVPTVAGALLRALCGQLIEADRARELERSIVRATSERVGRLAKPPTSRTLAARAPAELRRLGLHAGRAATLVRVCSALDLERLRDMPIEAAAQRLLRERGLGPWSLGLVALEGLGSYRYGLVGDLGLVKLVAALRGRWVESDETAELLEPYGEWAGLAGVYLLAGFSRGLLPVPAARRRARVRYAA